jgi:hypothetical protein
MNLTFATQKMGKNTLAVMHILRDGQPRTILDMEIMLGRPVKSSVEYLAFVKYWIKNLGRQTYQITDTGLVAMGEPESFDKPRHIRICNGSTTEIYNPAKHGAASVGIAIT